jgi:hypothetical protein
MLRIYDQHHRNNASTVGTGSGHPPVVATTGSPATALDPALQPHVAARFPFIADTIMRTRGAESAAQRLMSTNSRCSF